MKLLPFLYIITWAGLPVQEKGCSYMQMSRHRTPIYIRDAERRDVRFIVVIDRPHVIYINLLGDPNGLILLLRTL